MDKLNAEQQFWAFIGFIVVIWIISLVLIYAPHYLEARNLPVYNTYF
jgi:hypothetical protein